MFIELIAYYSKATDLILLNEGIFRREFYNFSCPIQSEYARKIPAQHKKIDIILNLTGYSIVRNKPVRR
jgi:hypothetical protein